MDHLFRQYHVENKAKNVFSKVFAIPRQMLEISAHQIMPDSLSTKMTLLRLKSQRKLVQRNEARDKAIEAIKKSKKPKV